MGILFISHSSLDNAAAIKVRNWLRDHGWSDVFLDLDPQLGLAPGHRWQQELKQAGERCSGVVVLVSPDWLASRWCQTEFLLADQLGKKIFPLLLARTPFDELPVELRAKFHLADISSPEKEAEGFERLAVGLKRAGLNPGSFEWPPPGEPHRAIYRGLQSLEEQDAAIFLGRDALITKGLDALRRMRGGAPERLLVILGASGAGKSSFLKAGLIARLKRDEENFLVLPIVRPERAALSGDRGLAASLGCDPAQLNQPQEIVAALAARRSPVIERFRRFAETARETYAGRPPTIVVAVDQAEELFAAENVEAARVLDLLAGALRGDTDTIVVATIRSDAFDRLQREPRLATVPMLPFSLGPLPHGAYKEVIEGPARLAVPPVSIEPELSDRLLQDMSADDALPLLAFTLERLSIRHRGGGTLTLAEYVEDLGGLKGAIQGAVEAAFAAAQRDPELPHGRVELEKLARAAFIPALVQLDDADAEPRRRVERLGRLPETTRALVRHLIDQRLLVCDRTLIDGVETDMVEVAHEAILRQWPTLRAWIAEERDALRTLDAARTAAREWNKHGEIADQGWLAHRGSRLEEAEALLARPDFTSALGATEREYLVACRARENAERSREQQALARTRRLQRNIAALIAVAAAIVVLAGAGIVELLAGVAARTSDTLAELAAKQSEAGNYDSSARYALAGVVEADWPFMGGRSNRAEAELMRARSASSALAVLRGNGEQMLAAAFSPDGSRIVTASGDTARLWDARTAHATEILRGHHGRVVNAAFSLDGRRIVTASEDKTARVWDTSTARAIAVLSGHGDAVEDAEFSPDGKNVVTASSDKSARIWDIQTGRTIAVLRGHDEPVETAEFSPDGSRIVTASDDGTARIWDAKAARTTGLLSGHGAAVNSAAFSRDGTHIVTAGQDGTARLWNASTAREIAALSGNTDAVNSAAFSPDGARIVTVSKDQTARIWVTNTGRAIAVLRGHEGAVNSGSFSADGKRIVTASDDGTARIWDADAAGDILGGHADAVNNAAYSPDGRHIVTASTDRTARIWDARTSIETAALSGHEGLVETAAYSHDGKKIVTASDDKTVRIWDANTAQQVLMLRGHEDRVNSAAFSPDGSRVVSASRDGTARVWDAKTGHALAVLRGHTGAVNSAAFSPEGSRIVTAGQDKTVRIWDARSGGTTAILKGHEDAVSNAEFSPDGRQIVSASRDGTARKWDADSGHEIAALQGDGEPLNSAAFSPDGRRIVTASWDKTARIWDADTDRLLIVLRGHGLNVGSAAFSPDGGHVVTASDDDTARIWNVSAVAAMPRAELIRRTCAQTLANGLSRFSAGELRAAPELDPQLDADACDLPGFWTRLGRIFRAGVSR